MKSPLRSKREALEELWRQGLSGQALLNSHAGVVDEFIQGCFLKADPAAAAESAALVALGGYGRQELFPYSDIDLMILYRPEIRDNIGPVADAVLYPLWDAGFEVGHGVRSIDEVLQLAEEDFFFRVAMIDARLLAGSQLLYFDMLSAYRTGFVEGRRRDFVETMERFRSERREKFGSHSYLLEPQIKEGKGGLRDIQTMLWTANVVFGLEGINGLVHAGILAADELECFTASSNMLIRIRNRLHYVSGRKNDRLYFEQQEEIAEAFSYREREGALAVEIFMRDVYAHMRNIAVVTDQFFGHVADVLEIGAGGHTADKVIEKGIELRNAVLHLVAGRADLIAKPHLLLRLFLASGRLGVPVHHRSRKIVATNLDVITDKVRCSTRAAKTFLAILENSAEVADVLEVMLETGLIAAFIPEFAEIQTLAQHDVYHVYTVDRHSLQTVDELHRVVAEQEAAFAMVGSSRVLFLGALLHDIGKGSGRDHSVEGAEIAGGVARRMGFNEQECEELRFLVRHHLFMPENALRRDLNDSEFIKNCAQQIGTPSRLAMLYLLAIADSRATGESAWSEWKASLLQEMFLRLKPYLEFSGFNLVQANLAESQVEQGVAWLRQQVSDLLAGEDGLRISVDELSSDYLLAFNAETVARHILMHRDNYRLLRQKALVRAGEEKESWSLLIMAVDRAGLLAKICGVMALNNLSVLNARIFTWSDGTVVDVLEVRPTDGTNFAERDWTSVNRELDLAIAHRLGLSHRLYIKLADVYDRRRELLSREEPEVIIDNQASAGYSVIEVYGTDREGQLYRITQTLTDFGMQIHKAFIATEVERLIDVFYVLDANGSKIEEADFQQELVQGLLHAVGCDTVKN